MTVFAVIDCYIFGILLSWILCHRFSRHKLVNFMMENPWKKIYDSKIPNLCIWYLTVMDFFVVNYSLKKRILMPKIAKKWFEKNICPNARFQKLRIFPYQWDIDQRCFTKFVKLLNVEINWESRQPKKLKIQSFCHRTVLTRIFQFWLLWHTKFISQ